MDTSAERRGLAGQASSQARTQRRPWGGALIEHLARYWRLMRLDRPIGAWLLLWPTLWGLWIASGGRPDEHVFVVMVLGAVLVRSTSCVINDLVERRYRPRVQQGSDRPVATGEVTPAEALIVFIGLMLIGLGLVLTLNETAVLAAFVGALLFIIYPYTKRFVSAPQVALGFTFGWGVPMAFAAQLGEIPRLGWLLFTAAVIWVVIYDTQYAMADREQDLARGASSAAILFGDLDRLFIGGLQLLLLGTLALIGREAGLGDWYQASLGGAAVLALYQQYLIRNRDPEACFDAFMNNGWFGGVVFAGILLDYLFGAA